MMTAKEAREIAALELGCDPRSPAVTLIVRAGARDRHEARVARARAAAEEAFGRDDPWRVWAALVSEANGAGGYLGLGGAARSTVREPWARGFGRGRHRACDGRAWTAAIREAAERVVSPMLGGDDAATRGIEALARHGTPAAAALLGRVLVCFDEKSRPEDIPAILWSAEYRALAAAYNEAVERAASRAVHVMMCEGIPGQTPVRIRD